jgi:hypothetical protein
MPRFDIKAIAASLLAATVCNHALAGEDVRPAWVELGENGQAIARVLTKSPGCPMLSLDGSDVRMQVRAAAGTSQRTGDLKPAAFPVTACELLLPPGTTTASIAGRKLPLPSNDPKLIAVIGDTGCRLKEGTYQSCNNADDWPFKEIADRVAALHPDLVIHAGDIVYRESECPGVEGCKGSPWGYGYDAFEADFFKPAANLLASAPWVFVRGNHEICGRAGQGWWRFFDPRPLDPGRDCNDPAGDGKGNYSEPYAVPLGPDFQLLVFDSSNATNGFNPEAAAKYEPQLKTAYDLAGTKPSIFLVHHPVLGFASKGPSAYRKGNETLQTAMKAVNPALFPRAVQATVNGHIHIFQVNTFGADYPASFVSGNGGTATEADVYVLKPGETPYGPAEVKQSYSTNEFGFMTMRRELTGWQIAEHGKNGFAVLSCVLTARIQGCDLPGASGSRR